MKIRYFNMACCLLSAISCYAGDSLSVIERYAVALQNAPALFEQSYANPAVKQWMRPVSIGNIAVSYTHDKQSDAVDPQLGDGSNIAAFDADAYIKNGSSTLWGNAFYRNGKQFNIECNETSDANLVYPYFTTDDIGGDMNLEQYYFAGGFADTHGNWSWGGTLSYLAGLYYRNVDPRPRNITGCLDAALGATYRIFGKYATGMSINFRKYKQSNDIDFVSEMGSSIIYHATGLGTHYNRFAGTGDAAYYNGYRYGVTANIYPTTGSGFIASLGASRFTFDKILTDLNKLPLCSVWHNSLNLQAGYSHSTNNHTTAIAFNYDFYRRHGKENIFGDAATSIYPQIGYLEMFADNYYSCNVDALYEFHGSQNRLLSIMPKVGYSHNRQVYADPRRDLLLNKMDYAIDLKGAISPSKNWLVATTLGYELLSPMSSSELIVSEPSDSENSLINVLERTFNYASHNQSRFSAGASLTHSFSSKYAIQFAIDYVHSLYVDNVNSNTISTSIKFVF